MLVSFKLWRKFNIDTQNLEMDMDDEIAGFSDLDGKSNPPTFRSQALASQLDDVGFMTNMGDSKTVRIILSLWFEIFIKMW